MDDVDQLSGLTLRGMESLPRLPPSYQPPKGQVVIVSGTVPLEGSEYFDARYTVRVALTDFGMFRIGEVHAGLAIKEHLAALASPRSLH